MDPIGLHAYLLISCQEHFAIVSAPDGASMPPFFSCVCGAGEVSMAKRNEGEVIEKTRRKLRAMNRKWATEQQ